MIDVYTSLKLFSASETACLIKVLQESCVFKRQFRDF